MNVMKKLFCAVLALTLVCALCACGSNTAVPVTTAAPAATEAPAVPEETKTAADSLTELNSAAGVNLSHPAVMGVTDESFWLIDKGDYKIAEYDFSINGIPYVLRAAAAAGDIDAELAGEYADTTIPAEDNYILCSASEKRAAWSDISGRYFLYVKDSGSMDADTFTAIVEEFSANTNPNYTDTASLYAGLAGDYTDSWSQRATATVTANSDSVTIVVHWSDSAFAYAEWTMTASLGETDGLLNYSNCIEKYITADSNGSSTEEVVYTNGSGFFSIGEDNSLIWNGAADENCTNCVFVKNA